MALRQGTLHHIERDRQDVADTAPRRAYLANHATVSGRYILSNAASEATAYLGASSIASATGRHLMYDTLAEETRALFLVTSTLVIG